MFHWKLVDLDAIYNFPPSNPSDWWTPRFLVRWKILSGKWIIFSLTSKKGISSKFQKLRSKRATFCTRPFQIQICCEFLACFFQLYNFFDFCSIFSWISHVFVRADLQNSCAHAVFCRLFSKIAILEKMRKIIENSSPNSSETLPKSFQNRWKIEKNWLRKPWWLK